MGNNKRAAFDFNDESETLDIKELAERERTKSSLPSAEYVKAVAEKSGFPSRDPQATRPRRRRGKKSPFTSQIGIRVRPEMKDLFQNIAEHLDIADNAAFEVAVLTLIEQHGTNDHKKKYYSILE